MKKKITEANQFGGVNNDSLEMYKWIKYYKPKHLVVGDLKSWNPGETKNVLVLDRNFEEYYIWPSLDKEKDYSPKHFFIKNKCAVKNNGDLTWNITDPGGDTICHNIEINVLRFYLWKQLPKFLLANNLGASINRTRISIWCIFFTFNIFRAAKYIIAIPIKKRLF
jgi:hypothetical protein